MLRVDLLYFWQAITTVIGALRVFALIAACTDVAVVAQIQSSIWYKQFIFRQQEGEIKRFSVSLQNTVVEKSSQEFHSQIWKFCSLGILFIFSQVLKSGGGEKSHEICELRGVTLS